VIGTAFNVGGIVLGGLAGLLRRKPLAPGNEGLLKTILGAVTVYFGLRLCWRSLGGTFLEVLKQITIMILALMLGRIIGRLLRLQRFSNSLGKAARDRISTARPDDPMRLSHGFQTCATLFCAAPLGILGAVQDGLSNDFSPLIIKGVMDGLATMGFVSLFGWGVLLSAIPVLAFQGTVTLLCSQLLLPFFSSHGLMFLVDSMNAVGGLLVFCVALIIFEVKKIELADYLPSLLVAPLLAYFWR
jgi:uncharacterized membrane protein YqgA involved in biofilm formation